MIITIEFPDPESYTTKPTSAVDHNPMPAVPTPSDEPLPRESGIYFVWSGDTIVYVGQTINLSSRVNSHEKIGPNDKLSWLLVPKESLLRYEHYYIWLLDPLRNSDPRLRSLMPERWEKMCEEFRALDAQKQEQKEQIESPQEQIPTEELVPDRRPQTT